MKAKKFLALFLAAVSSAEKGKTQVCERYSDFFYEQERSSARRVYWSGHRVSGDSLSSSWSARNLYLPVCSDWRGVPDLSECDHRGSRQESPGDREALSHRCRRDSSG